MNEEFLRKLGATTELLNHLRVEDPDDPFGYICCKPFYWKSSPIARREVIPLWECGLVISYFNVTSGCFEKCSLEDIDDVRSSYASVQGLLAELFIDAYENEIEIPVLTKYADQFGFRSLNRLLVEIDSP